jgi:hypothetical protein
MPGARLDLDRDLVDLPKPLRHQAPLLTFDGTLIDDMGFGTLRAQVLYVSNLPVRSADKPTGLLKKCEWIF